ncbi:MAG: AlpA family phage regulatory protein [Gammaproteobacteria bacterium]
MQKILRLSAVKEKTGLSRSGIYSMIAQGVFPSAISLGLRSVGWLEEEIENWISQQITKSRQKNEVKL